MIWLWLLLALLLLSFAGVLLFGAPYVPTLKPQVGAALKLADLKPGETLLELGCGDGRVMAAAASQGINVIGYELNPFLAAVAWLRTRRYRGQANRGRATVVWGDFWRRDWPPAEAIFTFLLPKYMKKLDKKVMQHKPKPVKLVSFAFQVPKKRPDAEKNGVYLYRYR